MPDCLIGLGSNVGDCRKNLHAAVEALEKHPQVSLGQVSQYFETSAVGGPSNQPTFLNAAARLETSLTAAEVLAVLHTIEEELGRERTIHWGPRILDLDLLLYGEAEIRQPQNSSREAATLIVPHRRMSFRRFVLEPAAEIAPDMRHPTIGLTIAELLAHLNNTPHLVALTGPSQQARTQLATEVATRTGCTHLTLGPDKSNTQPLHCGFDEQMAALATAAEKLRPENLPAGPTISDFWFDALLLHARSTLDASQLAEYERSWAEHHRTVARPRVIVIIEEEPSSTSTSTLQQQAAGQGAQLVLDTDDFEQQITEITAALLACK